MQKPTSVGVRPGILVAGIVSMFCMAIAGAVAIAWAIPNGANAGVLIAQLFAALALTIPALIGLAHVATKQEQTIHGVANLRNGEMDSKLRAAVAEVLRPHLIDPEIEPQLTKDREVRAATEHEGEAH